MAKRRRPESDEEAESGADSTGDAENGDAENSDLPIGQRPKQIGRAHV